MSTHNIVKASVTCPRCGNVTHGDIEGFVGFGNLTVYHVGDNIEWVPRKSVAHGGRPPHGTLDAEGYAVCDNCGKDFFVTLEIRNDKLEAVKPTSKRPGYMP
jgi:hypothetical protein